MPKLRHLDQNNFFLIAGPCVVEDESIPFEIAERIVRITNELHIPYIFKASYKKANRTRVDSFTGIGDIKALEVIRQVGETYDIPTLTDIHTEQEAVRAALYVDILQIPAFLCRQTDLLVAAGKTERVINIKKGQFASPVSMKYAIDKVKYTGNQSVMLTERGTTFGYNDLIVDFRNIPEMQKLNVPVIVDITHSLQQPNLISGVSGGRPELIEILGKAAVATGCDGIFLETHPNPGIAQSDGANMLKLDLLEELLYKLIKIRKALV
ncbi:MAG: 3-deoxy-8-phosphooctulonate synthase [Bacteroidetes bacterium]|nr:3-deoxy-8-phosphooctulonate synthase [Bacteroidota bacterium]